MSKFVFCMGGALFHGFGGSSFLRCTLLQLFQLCFQLLQLGLNMALPAFKVCQLYRMVDGRG
eukprot:m.392111 g.392111  ORF g.392111 m.392111 type:complete len:62 (+) comp20082_c1_seq23:2398-2583(+)